jgi:hypothetical protein
MTQPTINKLASALQQIVAARDHCAETGSYPAETVGKDQGFDDWAADLAERALDGVPPRLDIDTVLYGPEQQMGERQRTERQVVWDLFNVLAVAGFEVHKVDDGEATTKVNGNIKVAMELIFNLDDCHVYFKGQGIGHYPWIRLVMGNDGWDVVSDYSSPEDAAHPWRVAMDGFDFDQYDTRS